MSYRGGGGSGRKPDAAGNSSQRSFSMNAVPPPSSLMGRPNPFQKNFTAPKPTGLSKHGYSTMDAISQFANSSQYALGKRKTKTEDEYAFATSLSYIQDLQSVHSEIDILTMTKKLPQCQILRTYQHPGAHRIKTLEKNRKFAYT